jgi:hypothetical protein
MLNSKKNNPSNMLSSHENDGSSLVFDGLKQKSTKMKMTVFFVVLLYRFKLWR